MDVLQRIKTKHLNIIFYILLASTFIAGFFSLFNPYQLGWDESVYLKSGEYLSSGGGQGFIENLRPLGYPLFLSLFKMFGEDKVFIIRTIMLVMSIMTIMFLKKNFEIILRILGNRQYRRADDGKDDERNDLKNVAMSIIAATIILFFPEFFKESLMLSPEMFSLFLCTLSSLIILGKAEDILKKEKNAGDAINAKDEFDLRLFFAGIIIAYAVYSRFIYGLSGFIAGILVISLFARRETRRIKKNGFEKTVFKKNMFEKIIVDWKMIGSFFIGTILVALSFSILHYSLYSDEAVSADKPAVYGTMWPVINQFLDHAKTRYAWMNDDPSYYYLEGIFSWTTYSILFIPGMMFFLMNYKNKRVGRIKKRIIVYSVLSLLIPLFFLSTTRHKEMRYLLICIPWIVFFSTYFFRRIVDYRKNKGKNGKNKKYQMTDYLLKTIPIIFIIIASTIIISSASHDFKTGYRNDDYGADEYSFYNELSSITPEKTVLTTTPVIKTSGKETIGYYSEEDLYKKLEEKTFDYIFFTSNTFPPCRESDFACSELNKNISVKIEKEYALFKRFNKNILIYQKKKYKKTE